MTVWPYTKNKNENSSSPFSPSPHLSHQPMVGLTVEQTERYHGCCLHSGPDFQVGKVLGVSAWNMKLERTSEKWIARSTSTHGEAQQEADRRRFVLAS